jgi:RNA polymerase-binding transcription factor DksA
MSKDKLTDPLDVAAEQEQSFRAESERQIREQVKRLQYKNEDGTWPEPDCEECGYEIGEGRLEATGSKTCIKCATAKEHNRSFGRS